MEEQRIEYGDTTAEAMLHLLRPADRIGFCPDCRCEVPARKDGLARKTCHRCKVRLRPEAIQNKKIRPNPNRIGGRTIRKPIVENDPNW